MTDAAPKGFGIYAEFIRKDDDAIPPTYADEWLNPDWSLVQVLAWIAERSPAWARRLALEYL